MNNVYLVIPENQYYQEFNIFAADYVAPDRDLAIATALELKEHREQSLRSELGDDYDDDDTVEFEVYEFEVGKVRENYSDQTIVSAIWSTRKEVADIYAAD